MTIYRGEGGGGNATTDSEITLLTQLQQSAALSETNAAASAAAAAASEAAADSDAIAAAASAAAAATSASNAATSASNASISASNAATSETNAATSASSASGSATAAALSETNAASSASSASTSATNAATSASNALTSETNAASSASSAATSATNASNSASAALTSENNAAASASAASVSASNAATSEANAAASAAAAATFNPANFVEIAGDTMTGNLTVPSLTNSGNFTFTGTGARITGDFSNATVANRVMFQTSTVNGQTSIGVLPNGTSTIANINLFGGIDTANASIGQLVNTGTEVRLGAVTTGTGTYLPMTFYTGGSERMRIDTNGNVGVGTNAPGQLLDVNGNIQVRSTNSINFFNTDYFIRASTGLELQSVDFLRFLTNGANERLRIDSSGNFFTGGTFPAFFCRAWVNFNGTGTVAIRAAGNVSSITDNGTGDYTINFTTAMPDANYATSIEGEQRTGDNLNGLGVRGGTAPTVSTVRIFGRNQSGTATDFIYTNVAVFR